MPGRVLDVDLQQWSTGGWVYKFLVLDSEGGYSEVFVDALTLTLSDHHDLAVVGTATTVAQAMRVVDQVDFDVLILDLVLGSEDGLAVARHVLADRPDAGVLVATGSDGSTQMLDAVQLGVRGWVVKTVTAPELVRAVRGVAAGETCIPAEMLASVLVSVSQTSLRSEHVAGMDELTGRELEVLGCLVEGMSRSEIGALLHVSPNTVRTHVQSILHKLKVHSALAAVAIARRAGVSRDNLTSA